MRAMDLARAMIFGAVERDQHVPVEPAEQVETTIDLPDLIERRGEHRVQQSRRGRVEHVTDVIVTGDPGEAEQTATFISIRQVRSRCQDCLPWTLSGQKLPNSASIRLSWP